MRCSLPRLELVRIRIRVRVGAVKRNEKVAAQAKTLWSHQCISKCCVDVGNYSAGTAVVVIERRRKTTKSRVVRGTHRWPSRRRTPNCAGITEWVSKRNA